MKRVYGWIAAAYAVVFVVASAKTGFSTAALSWALLFLIAWAISPREST